MRELAVLEEDPLAVYDAIVHPKEEPRRGRLHALRQRILCAYLRYYAHGSALERLRPLGRRLSAQEADDLRHCYTISRQKGSAVYDRVYAKILALSYFCAYCGVNQAITLDHYFPKDGRRGFPEFSILPANLVPSCGRCNVPRAILDAAGHRVLVHPYFDVILQEPLLIAEVTVADGVPDVTFRVDPSGCSSPQYAQLFERHVRLLDLLERYRVLAMQPDDVLSDIERTVRKWAKGRDRAQIVALLSDGAAEHACKLGVNHFKTVLTRGAAASDAFVDFCLTRKS